jgi:hypothetical protein
VFKTPLSTYEGLGRQPVHKMPNSSVSNFEGQNNSEEKVFIQTFLSGSKENRLSVFQILEKLIRSKTKHTNLKKRKNSQLHFTQKKCKNYFASILLQLLI